MSMLSIRIRNDGLGKPTYRHNNIQQNACLAYTHKTSIIVILHPQPTYRFRLNVCFKVFFFYRGKAKEFFFCVNTFKYIPIQSVLNLVIPVVVPFSLISS